MSSVQGTNKDSSAAKIVECILHIFRVFWSSESAGRFRGIAYSKKITVLYCTVLYICTIMHSSSSPAKVKILPCLVSCFRIQIRHLLRASVLNFYGPWISTFFWPCEMALSCQGSAISGPKKSRFPGPNTFPLTLVMDLPASKPLYRAVSIRGPFVVLCTWAPMGDRASRAVYFYFHTAPPPPPLSIPP